MTRKQIGWTLAGVWLAINIILFAVVGVHAKNNEFQIQNEFQLHNWVHLGVFSINRAVLYVFLAAVLTAVTMVFVARRMQARPNRVQTAVETIYGVMRDRIVGDNMDDAMAARWFPFLGTLFLFIWYSNLLGYLPLPTNSAEKFNLFGAHIPSFSLYAATANISVPLVLALVVFIIFNTLGIRAHGPIGYVKSLVPAGVTGFAAIPLGVLEVISTVMRLLSLTIRLFANILAGHMIILFFAGGLAVILGLGFLGWATLPFALLIYLFELTLIAFLQAFIFAILAAIYFGGAVSTH
ncbi:MAG TPA: F0F1 ATP synthase subunit A [Solirubrobacteraceae bacterium]|nr:F0F1 ATP synthase subunit A [Solirubrobacteraceae bacterium]